MECIKKLHDTVETLDTLGRNCLNCIKCLMQICTASVVRHIIPLPTLFLASEFYSDISSVDRIVSDSLMIPWWFVSGYATHYLPITYPLPTPTIPDLASETFSLPGRSHLRLRSEGSLSTTATRLQAQSPHTRRRGAAPAMDSGLPRSRTHHQGPEPPPLRGDGLPPRLAAGRSAGSRARQEAYLPVLQLHPRSPHPRIVS